MIRVYEFTAFFIVAFWISALDCQWGKCYQTELIWCLGLFGVNKNSAVVDFSDK